MLVYTLWYPYQLNGDGTRVEVSIFPNSRSLGGVGVGLETRSKESVTSMKELSPFVLGLSTRLCSVAASSVKYVMNAVRGEQATVRSWHGTAKTKPAVWTRNTEKCCGLRHRARSVESRRKSMLDSLEKRNLLDDALKNSLMECTSSAQLELQYEPYKEKKHTKAELARQAGLAPVADTLLRSDQPIDVAILDDAAKHVLLEALVCEQLYQCPAGRDLVCERLAKGGLLRSAFLQTAAGKPHKNSPLSSEPSYNMYSARTTTSRAV